MNPNAFSDFRPELPDFYLGDTDPVFARLREEDPVHWYEGEGSFWCVTRYAHIRSISSRPREFCSAEGIAIPIVVNRQAGRPEGPPGLRPMEAPTIIDLDPPKHNLHRKLVIDYFKPRATAQLEARIRQIARESIDRISPGEPVDFVEAVSIPLPMIIIADMLGVPREDHDRFRIWSDATVKAANGNPDEPTMATIIEMFGYLGEQLAHRRTNPKDDLISKLLQAEVDGKRLTEGELLMFCMILLVGGNETTRTLISGGTRALLDNPGEREKLVAAPGLVPNAVEEMLRYVSPLHSFARKAVVDAEVDGHAIRGGDYVVMFYSAANRDRSVFGDDADAFIVDRPTARRQIAFGHGEHLCLGASLARLEARVMFEELLPRLDGLRYDGEVERLRSIQINGIERMPVVFER